MNVHLKQKLFFWVIGETNGNILQYFAFINNMSSETFICIEVKGHINICNGRMDGRAGEIGGDGKINSFG